VVCGVIISHCLLQLAVSKKSQNVTSHFVHCLVFMYKKLRHDSDVVTSTGMLNTDENLLVMIQEKNIVTWNSNTKSQVIRSGNGLEMITQLSLLASSLSDCCTDVVLLTLIYPTSMMYYATC